MCEMYTIIDLCMYMYMYLSRSVHSRQVRPPVTPPQGVFDFKANRLEITV